MARLKHLFWSSIWVGACFREIQARVALRRGRPRRFGEVCGGAAACGGGGGAPARGGRGVPATLINAGVTPRASGGPVPVFPPPSPGAPLGPANARRTVH